MQIWFVFSIQKFLDDQEAFAKFIRQIPDKKGHSGNGRGISIQPEMKSLDVA